ncbi:hypothetical protein [Ideonella sp. A 288]|uniref:HzsA-related protein n=1 Tax=Ideonella sp. A 288 TaxID=1962181 RepID=UPI000B4AC8B0|nr:hypothetical protein [Ideonella sp. A 288]
MREALQRLIVWFAAAVWLASGIAACSGGGTDRAESTVTVSPDVPIVYVKRPVGVRMNPTNGAPGAAGGDLMLREQSSPSAPEHNLTARFTQGQGDASDPEVSYDGKRVVFAMRCPVANTSTIDGAPACTGRWNVWEYDMRSATQSGGLLGGSFRRLTHSTDSDDVDPVYLPAGRGIVFTSNRQTRSRALQALGRNYLALDEYERERVFNLHTMDADGGAIAQISFNQSHDRNPVVRPNGDIMFSRWDHVGGRNHFTIFRAKPDGTDLFVLYGAHSEGNSYLHPRDMDPAGAFKGQVATSLMPLSGTQEGGALVLVDAANYSEKDTPANASAPAQGGQRQITAQPLAIERGLSMFGRVTTPYPLWDGTDRILAAFRPCEVLREGVVVPCASLNADEMRRITSERSRAEAAADTLQDNAPAAYGIYMHDPAKQTWLNVASPPPGFMYTDPVALLPRPEPSTAEATTIDPALATQGLGLIEVRSVYDTDGLGRMGDAVIAEADRAGACAQPIPKIAPTDPQDLRPQVADLARMKDPADPAYHCSPARLLRVVRAVAPPAGGAGMREAIGDTDFEQQQILGYAPIEPDGSIKLTVPADVPIALAVVDAKGRAFQTHTNWIQVRPGERRTCDGCHSPRRGGALNSGAVVNALPAALRSALASAHQPGETMAGTRTRLDAAALLLQADLLAPDAWADTTRPGVRAREAVALRYTGNTLATDDLATAAPQRGIVNYAEQIQPLWTRDRGAVTCVNCHTPASRLDLTTSIAGTGRLNSYERLLNGQPLIDAATGQPQTRLEDGVPVAVRGPALVDNGASQGEAIGLARKSRLVELLSGDTLMAGSGARSTYPAPAALDHRTLLNRAEQRLLAEWIDLGGQYTNDPFDANGRPRGVTGLSEATFAQTVLPVLREQCLGCHQPVGSTGATGTTGGSGATPATNRLVLTGDAEGDFNVALSLVNDACNPARSTLLDRPSRVPHPSGALAQAAPVLPPAGAGYKAIAAWIAGGCPR